MLNNVTIQGRLVADPEVKMSKAGISYTNITLAVERNYGKKEDRVTDFLPVSLFRQSAEFVGRFHKGDMFLVEGSLYQEHFTTQSGENRTTYRINGDRVFLASTATRNTAPAPAPAPAPEANNNVTPMMGYADEPYDSADLPF